MTTHLDVWKVMTTVNEYDGYGDVVGYYSTESLANAASRGKGWYGSVGAITKMKGLNVEGQIYLLSIPSPIVLDSTEEAKQEIIRQRALAKLSPEEKKVLGHG